MGRFETECRRARNALRLAGAVDTDGHLTEYGRDVERFPGSGSEALALMLSEQLACVHEVAFSLHVLGGSRLFGGKISYSASTHHGRLRGVLKQRSVIAAWHWDVKTISNFCSRVLPTVADRYGTVSVVRHVVG